jgi:hypothetical protein
MKAITTIGTKGKVFALVMALGGAAAVLLGMGSCGDTGPGACTCVEKYHKGACACGGGDCSCITLVNTSSTLPGITVYAPSGYDISKLEDGYAALGAADKTKINNNVKEI